MTTYKQKNDREPAKCEEASIVCKSLSVSNCGWIRAVQETDPSLRNVRGIYFDYWGNDTLL